MVNTYRPAKNAEWKPIAPRVRMFLPGTVEVSDTPRTGWTLAFDLDFDGERVSPVGVHIKSAGEAVTGTDLRAVAVNELLSTSLVGGLHDYLAHDADWNLSPSEAERSRVRREGPTEENIRFAAELYLFARAIRTPATDFVQNTLDISKPTAARWLRKARELELIRGDD